MPTYEGRIDVGKLTFLRPDLFSKWSKSNIGSWFSAEFKILGKHEDPKTAAQLGFYWACLVPEINRQLIAEGHTMTVRARELSINKDATHELLTELCGQVGSEGKHLRLSECSKLETIKFIDNVVEFACANLGMNEEALKAQRPG